MAKPAAPKAIQSHGISPYTVSNTAQAMQTAVTATRRQSGRNQGCGSATAGQAATVKPSRRTTASSAWYPLVA